MLVLLCLSMADPVGRQLSLGAQHCKCSQGWGKVAVPVIEHSELSCVALAASNTVCGVSALGVEGMQHTLVGQH